MACCTGYGWVYDASCVATLSRPADTTRCPRASPESTGSEVRAEAGASNFRRGEGVVILGDIR